MNIPIKKLWGWLPVQVLENDAQIVQKQIISLARSRKKGMFYAFISAFVVSILGFFDVPLTIAIPLLFAFLIGYYLAMPFLFELSDHEEPLW